MKRIKSTRRNWSRALADELATMQREADRVLKSYHGDKDPDGAPAFVDELRAVATRIVDLVPSIQEHLCTTDPAAACVHAMALGYCLAQLRDRRAKAAGSNKASNNRDAKARLIQGEYAALQQQNPKWTRHRLCTALAKKLIDAKTLSSPTVEAGTKFIKRSLKRL